MSSERQLDNTNNPWWGEHLHRYEEAGRLLANKSSDVLDIACGSGFGSAYLASLGNKVIGADLSEATVEDCRNKFNNNNLSFEVIDGTCMSFKDQTFDAIVSFETIEHTTEYQKMLNEFKRVVKSDGLIILSTPNFLINSPTGIIVNKFHTQEWVYEDLLKILNNTFSDVKFMGQEYIRYKSKNTLRYKLGNLFENLLYMRGVRKLPIKIQNIVMNLIINEPMYPRSSNYALTQNIPDIKKCKTFFIICKP
jgi:2-polyprenyl-3-methyl-5-hydroxy-6-metoxy-1,4-benzoquinol methylase